MGEDFPHGYWTYKFDDLTPSGMVKTRNMYQVGQEMYNHPKQEKHKLNTN